VDLDGRLDLYVGNYVEFGPHTNPQLCGSSEQRTACGPSVYAAHRGVLYRNEGSHFRDITQESGAHQVMGKALGVAWGEVDNSGRPELAIANDEVAGDLLQHNGTKYSNVGVASGTAFDRLGKAHGGMGIDWGDYNNDGSLDIFVATFQNEEKCLYQNRGDGTFVERSTEVGLIAARPYVGFGVKLFDADNDGWLDLMLANGHVMDNVDLSRSTTYRQSMQFFQSTRDSTNNLQYRDARDALDEKARRPIVGRGLAVGDYDNDGRVDALLVDSEGSPLLMHNDGSKTGNWLSVQLQGTESNRDGIGTLVTVETGKLRLTRRCGTDGSYLSASDKRVHFGLGSIKSIERLTVRWPGGQQSTLSNVPINRLVTVKQ
jgi:hypothetical protein